MFMSLIEKRRSIRRFSPQPVEAEKIDRLVEAALRAPSSRGLNPWQFIVVTDKALLGELAKCKPHGASFLKQAGLGIVVCADPERCDVWIEDCAIAAIFIQLAATAMELGSCWVQVRERMHDAGRTAQSHVAELLRIPAHLTVASIMAVGYADEQKPPHKKTDLAHDKIHRDYFGS